MIPHTKPSGREGGFTLVELLIAVAVSGILITAITTGFIATLRGTATAHDRLVASNGSHTLATYFTADVESANPDLTTTDPAATMGCASEPPGSTTKLLHLQWSERTTSTELRAFSVSYRILASDTDGVPGDDRWQLVRYACSASEDPFTSSTAAVLSGAPLTQHVVVSDLHEPVAPSATEACIGTTCSPAQAAQVVLLEVFAAPVKGESTPYSYTFSGTMRTPEPAPRVLSIKRNGAAATTAATVEWTVTFSEAVGGVDAGDFSFFYTGGLTGASVTSVTPVSDTVYTVEASTGSGSGTVALTVDDDDTIVSLADGDKLGGTGLANGNYTGGGYSVTVVAPTVVVNRNSTQAATVTSLPAPNAFTVTFNELVTGFNDGDPTDATPADVINTGTAGDVVFLITPVGAGGTDYLLSVQSAASTGTIIPQVIANAAANSVGTGNVISTDGPDNLVTYGTSTPPPPPTGTIASVDLWNGGTAGKIEQGDKIIVKFSESMNVNTFCSSWSASSTPTLNANGKVVITVENNTATGGHDKLLLSTSNPVCNFKFGEINLGSNGYVSTLTKFEGNNTDASSIAWDAATNTLTITLGKANTAPTATVGSSAPIYDAHDDIRTATNGVINNSPLTLTNEQQF